LPYPRLIAKICNNAGVALANEQQTNKASYQTNTKQINGSQRDLIISNDRVVLGSQMKASLQSGFLPSPYGL
jgi:hypothetical protein